MDRSLVLATFVSIFLAELGDKTQLATFSLAGGHAGARWSVFLGSALALVLSSAIAVLAGEFVGRVIPPIWLKRGAVALFIVLGSLMLLSTSSK
jgi:putative Ca2+/H+ antiporter (TMEM165/GDT1 family)